VRVRPTAGARPTARRGADLRPDVVVDPEGRLSRARVGLRCGHRCSRPGRSPGRSGRRRALCDAAPMRAWRGRGRHGLLVGAGRDPAVGPAVRRPHGHGTWTRSASGCSPRTGPAMPAPARSTTRARPLNLSNNAASRAAVEVHKGLKSVWEMEDRTRSSIYATAQTVVWPWSDPASPRRPARPSRGKGRKRQGFVGVDLRWLLSGAEHRLPVLADRGPAPPGPGVRWAAERPDQPGVPARRRDRQAPRPAAAGRDRRGRQHAAAVAAGVRVDPRRARRVAGDDLAVASPSSNAPTGRSPTRSSPTT
jgi:hypothetical protein